MKHPSKLHLITIQILSREKFGIEITTSAETQGDLALAYSPGVAEPVRAIAENPEAAYDYTIKGNLVAVISNGTAILGLGNLGALASKPVMEGKALLFKRFANIDSIDIEVDSEDPDVFVDTVKILRKLLVVLTSKILKRLSVLILSYV